ncbi:MAG TPA: hypothetical protein VNU71_17470, partial [Burkholderiaceae bacterium]|nr:hypothetical protein [Burkholderiaceae bacterium]
MSRAVPIDPKLPRNFDNTPNEDRPASHQRWWNRPFIVTETIEQLEAWAAGRTDEYADKFRAETFPAWRAEW